MGYIYFAKIKECPAVKIGFSIDVSQRLRNLNLPFDFVKTLRGDTKREKELHAFFGEYRIDEARELFRYEGELKSFCDGIGHPESELMKIKRERMLKIPLDSVDNFLSWHVNYGFTNKCTNVRSAYIHYVYTFTRSRFEDKALSRHEFLRRMEEEGITTCPALRGYDYVNLELRF